MISRSTLALATFCLAVALSACGAWDRSLDGEGEPGDDTSSGGDPAADDEAVEDEPPGDVGAADDPEGGEAPDEGGEPPPDGEPAARIGRCGDPAPSGAPEPPPLPAYSMGVCPSLTAGTNRLTSSGRDRDFILVLPAGFDPAAERPPLLVMWHYLGGAADSMLSHGQVQEAADELRFIAAIPEKTGDLAVGFGDWEFDAAWPYMSTVPEGRMEEEAVFFDDMVTCIAAQLGVDESCISSVGVSAGGLWTAQLAQLRSERLASIVLLSGGTGPATGIGFVDVRGFRGMARPLPALIGWGGSSDFLGVNFQRASMNLESALEDNGHFVMECIHNCGHGVPPEDHEQGLSALYRFALDHPYWVEAGRSVYQVEGLSAGTPAWCALGAGRAEPRTGPCDPDDSIEG